MVKLTTSQTIALLLALSLVGDIAAKPTPSPGEILSFNESFGKIINYL